MKGNERNKPCKCGGKLKYKKCCGKTQPKNQASIKQVKIQEITDDVKKQFARKKIEEVIRKQQQGLGKPILSADLNDTKFVFVGNRAHYSKTWKTFPDFLFDFIISKLGYDWGNQELKKPLQDRHPIMQWYDSVCCHQNRNIKSPGQVSSSKMNGAMYCYYGLAYSLYLLNHNVELQGIYLHRLKDTNNFQGTYYELIVANCLIRSGFTLKLEDETDESSKHCEFSATSTVTGKKYWVEAKARSVAGVLGKDAHNGTKSKDPTNQLSKHVREALLKPAKDDRLIFVDLNSPPESSSPPSWVARAGKQLDQKERDLKGGQAAYVFVTNMCFHWDLESENHTPMLLAHGLGIPDFGKVGYVRLRDSYKNKKKHIDAHQVGEGFKSYGRLPATFDGKMASEVFSDPDTEIKVGETYFFSDIGENGLLAKVTTATVIESEKKIYFATNCGKILTRLLSDDQLADYRQHKEFYFGEKISIPKKTENIFDFFEEMVNIHLGHPRESVLAKVRHYPDFEILSKLDHEALVLEYCERMCAEIAAGSLRRRS